MVAVHFEGMRPKGGKLGIETKGGDEQKPRVVQAHACAVFPTCPAWIVLCTHHIHGQNVLHLNVVNHRLQLVVGDNMLASNAAHKLPTLHDKVSEEQSGHRGTQLCWEQNGEGVRRNVSMQTVGHQAPQKNTLLALQPPPPTHTHGPC